MSQFYEETLSLTNQSRENIIQNEQTWFDILVRENREVLGKYYKDTIQERSNGLLCCTPPYCVNLGYHEIKSFPQDVYFRHDFKSKVCAAIIESYPDLQGFEFRFHPNNAVPSNCFHPVTLYLDLSREHPLDSEFAKTVRAIVLQKNEDYEIQEKNLERDFIHDYQDKILLILQSKIREAASKGKQCVTIEVKDLGGFDEKYRRLTSQVFSLVAAPLFSRYDKPLRGFFYTLNGGPLTIEWYDESLHDF